MKIYRYPEDPNSFLVEVQDHWFYIWDDKISPTPFEERFHDLPEIKEEHYIPMWVLTAVLTINGAAECGRKINKFMSKNKP